MLDWLDRRAPSSAGPLTLGYRRIYILPTRQGLAFAALLTVLWLGGVNYGNSLALAFTFLLAGVYLAAMTQTFRNLLGIRLTPGRTEDTFCGENATFRLHLETDRRTRHPAIEIATDDGPAGPATDVAGHGPTEVRLHRPTRRRGLLPLGTITVTTRYPTGLFRAWSRLRPETSCLVYPAPEQAPPPVPPDLGDRGRGGRLAHGDEDFAGLRQYRPGDPVRRIAWKASSHGSELQVKEFAGEGAARLWLDWEATAGLTVEDRLSRLCRWVMDAHRDGRVYGLRLPGETAPPSAGEAHYRHCLRALAQHEP